MTNRVHPGWDADEQPEPPSTDYNMLPVGRVIPRRMEPIRVEGKAFVDQTLEPKSTWGQPDPIPNDAQDIQSQVIEDIKSRRQHGIDTYGTALQPFNGRDAVRDAYEEAIDLTMYLKQLLVEGVDTPYETLWDEIAEWSNRVFGDEQARGPIGPLNHLRREAQEAIDDIVAGESTAEVEIADCLILVFDAARRYRMSPMLLVGTALEKMIVNRGRKMGKPDAEGVIEHVRDFPPAAAKCSACGRTSYDQRDVGTFCLMTQPDGTACKGYFALV